MYHSKTVQIYIVVLGPGFFQYNGSRFGWVPVLSVPGTYWFRIRGSGKYSSSFSSSGKQRRGYIYKQQCHTHSFR